MNETEHKPLNQVTTPSESYLIDIVAVIFALLTVIAIFIWPFPHYF